VSGGITLGHFLIGFAIIDVIAMLLMVRAAKRANPDPSEDQRRGWSWMVAAAFLTAIGLCLVAIFLPAAQMRLI
jgi:uncharacterized membrane protein YidH (DUF202 family)